MSSINNIPQNLLDRIRRNNCLVNVSVRHCQFTIKAYLPDDYGRLRVENYIQYIFLKQHRAKINDFHPLLITIENSSNEIIAALGMRFAGQQRLIAEEYSARPISSLLLEKMKVKSERKQIIEIGNLASSHSGYAKFLFVAMTKILADWHFQWLTFTAVPAVVNIFNKLKLQPVEVCLAQLKNLSSNNSDWGDYYQHQPHVMLGDITSANGYLEQQGSYQRIHFQWL